MDLPKGKGKGNSPEDLRRAEAFFTFFRNVVFNFSCWHQVWEVNFFMAVLWSGFQKELSQEDDRLPQGLLSTYFPGMFRGRVLSGLYFAYEANLYCRSTFHHESRAFCRRLNVELGRLLIDRPMDLVPFTFYICFSTTTWDRDLIVSSFSEFWSTSDTFWRRPMDLRQ